MVRPRWGPPSARVKCGALSARPTRTARRSKVRSVYFLRREKAKPDTNSVSGKVMNNSPGVQGAGKTDMPNAKPTDGSVSSKEMQDNPGARK